MYSKMAQSQSTIISNFKDTRVVPYNARDEQTTLKNPYNQTLPMKFPKNAIRKPTSQHILHETVQQSQPYSVRVYGQANRSRHFEDLPTQLSQSQLHSRNPKLHFDNIHPRKLSSPGTFQHLARQSAEFPVRLRTYEDIGVTNNEKRLFSRNHYKPDPIVVGQRSLRHNSSLEKVWAEPRRHRDNGIELEKVVQWNPKLSKRDPYQQKDSTKIPKSTSYKDMYLKSKVFKI